MKKYVFLLTMLFLYKNLFAAPSNTMSILPVAVDGATITASDENTRNNTVVSTYNAHTHTDISQTGNTLNVGDALAGDKTINAYNADSSKPYLKYDDTNNYWIFSTDLAFEGTTSNDYETTLSITDPTADRTITIPNNTGTVVLSGASVAQTLTFSGDTISNLGAVTTADINGGTIDGVTLGGSSAVAITSATATSITGITTFTAGGDLDIGSYEIRAQTLESDVATGTAPLTITSTTKVSNLNADLLDGLSVANVGSYFQPDGTCIIAFDNASKGTDISDNAITLTSLADSDLVDGKVGKKCYDFDGANDYLEVATNANQAGMSALTIEAWVYVDSIDANYQSIVCNDTNSFISFTMNTTNLVGSIVTSSGTEDITQAHGLASGGVGAWAYVVLTWDSASASIIYVNGASIGTGDDEGNGTISDSTDGIYIGAIADESGRFNGKIDGVRILRRKMGATEVLARYNAYN